MKDKNPDWLEVTPQMVLKVLIRNSDYTDEPERKLWLAVLGQAVTDTDVRFFSGTYDHDLRAVALMAGLDADFVRETCLPFVTAHWKEKMRLAELRKQNREGVL